MFVKVSAGSMAAVALRSAYTMDALAQETSAEAGYQFFTAHEAETIDALAEQIWPTTETSPGGSDAGVVVYIDRALGGAYQRYQPIYQAGIQWLDDATNEQFGDTFVGLAPEQQFELMDAVFNADATPAASPAATPEPQVDGVPVAATPEDTAEIAPSDGKVQVAGGEGPHIASLKAFLDLVRVHTMEGLFSDPVYGGNRDFAGWRAVGYPGPYIVYGAEEQQSFEPLNQPLQSIADL